MRRCLIVLAGLFCAFTAKAQEKVDYLSFAFPDETVPESIAVYDMDGQPFHFTATQLGFDEGDSWICLREPSVYPYNYFIASHSRHKKVTGQDPVSANDWMVLPSVFVREDDAVLTWRSNSVCENLETTSTYKIRISTKGNQPEDFTQEALLTVGEDEINTWTEHSQSLGAYVGQRIWIAFVNETNNGELLAIDDICVTGGQGAYSFTTNLAPYVCGQTSFTPQLTFINLSDEPIKGFKIHSYKYDSTSNIGREMTVDKTIDAHGSLTVDFWPQIDVQYGDTLNFKVDVEVKGVNSDAVFYNTVFLSFEPRQHVVIEEGTGNWCGWCPKGIYAIGVLRKNYGDTILPICVHYDDPMEVSGYIGDKGIYFPLGFPSGTINRKYDSQPLAEVHEGRKTIFTTLYGGLETWVLEELKSKPMAEIDLKVGLNGNKLNLISNTKFCIPQKGTDLRMAYILTEDHYQKKGLNQKNYLAGNDTYEDIGDYSKLPSVLTDFEFEDVARGAAQSAFQGIKGAIPTDVEIDKVYEHKTTMTVPSSVSDINNCSVTAILIDNKTGYIVNATRVNVEEGAAAIEEVSGNASQPFHDIYDLQGRKVRIMDRGIYIMNGKKYLR